MSEISDGKVTENGVDSAKDEGENESPEGILTCKVCDKVYKKKGSFEKHLKLHFGSEKLPSKDKKVVGPSRAKKKSINYKEEDEDFVPLKKLGKKSVTRTKITKKYKVKVKRKQKKLESDSDDSLSDKEGAESGKQTDEELYEPEEDIQCKICDRRFVRAESLTVHMHVHSGEKPFPCHICNKRFLRRDHLKTHIKRHSTPAKYSCDMCGETFKREDHLKYHKINNHEGTIYLNELKVFNKTGKTKSDSEKTHLCEICGKGFIDQQRLKVHRKIHTESKRYQCEFCYKSFSNSSNFNVHIRLHTGKNPYKCCVCGECFRTSSRLKTHTRKHSGEYPFVCEVCGKMCGEKHLLQMHLLTHSGQKTHECHHCGKSFAHSSTLRSHIRLHTGSKPFVCSVCGHSFAQVSSLNYHKRTHTGEKPYICHLCGNSYTRRTTLNTHLLRHSGTKLVSCSLCEYTCYTTKQRKKHMSAAHNLPPGAAKTTGKNATQKNTVDPNDPQVCKENDYITLKSAIQPSTFTPHRAVSVSEQLDFNSPISTANVTVPGYTTQSNEDVSMKNNSNNMPIYFNITQGFRDSSDIPQSATHVSTNHRNSHVVNPSFNPSPHGELTLQVPEIRNLNSSSYQINPTINFSYPSNTAAVDVVNMNTNNLPVIDNRVIYSQKNPSLSPSSYFQPVATMTLPKNPEHDLTVCAQTPSQFSNASNIIMVEEKNFVQPAAQKQAESDKNNIWLTIGTSPAHLSQNYNRDRECVLSDNRHVSTSLTVTKSDNAVENRNAVPEDLIHRAMVSAEISQHGVEISQHGAFVENSALKKKVTNDNIVVNSVPMSLPVKLPSTSGNEFTKEGNELKKELFEERSAQPEEEAIDPEESDHENDIELLENKSNSESEDVLPETVENEIESSDEEEKQDEASSTKRNTRQRTLQVKLRSHTRAKKESKSDQKATKKGHKQVTKVAQRSKRVDKRRGKMKRESLSDNDSDHSDFQTKDIVTQKRSVKKERLYSCVECGLEFSRAEHLSKHLSTHKKPKPLICLFCLQHFEKKMSLAEHIEQEHEGQRPFSCNACQFSCIDVLDLKHHVKLSHYDIEYKCDICSESFAKSKYLKDHMTKNHKGSQAFSCHACNKSYAECSLLVLHNKQKHSGVKAFKCNLCSKVFVAAAKLQNHLRVHTGDKPFTCEFCGKVFAQLSLLSIHVKAHSSEKPFACGYCNQSFTHKSTLTAHIRIHTGAKPFECDVCGKGFAQLSSLNYHRKSHDGLKPFTCELCGKSFTRATTLKTHLMQHAGKKRFSCELCDFKCNRKHALRKHHDKKHSSLCSEEKIMNASQPNEIIFNNPQIIKETIPAVASSSMSLTPFLQIPIQSSPPQPLLPTLDQNKHQQELLQLQQSAKLEEPKEVYSQQMPGFFFPNHQPEQQLLPIHSGHPTFQITFQPLHHYHQPG